MYEANLPPELTRSGNVFIKIKYKYHIIEDLYLTIQKFL